MHLNIMEHVSVVAFECSILSSMVVNLIKGGLGVIFNGVTYASFDSRDGFEPAGI